MSLSAGTRLGPYEMLAPLGAGGMGEVYRARDTRLNREVAIKVLPAELASDASRLKRFQKEALSASALSHPNIVTVYDIGSENGLSYIAMERVAGETLRKLLVNGALSVKRLLSIATQIGEGLAKAHEAGIVHRDLKPENLMVTKDGLVKILDFGLAKPTHVGSGSDEGSHLPTETGTSPRMIVGTVGYMSPEQASGEAVDYRSDQFSFGSIVYEMATGKRAFLKKTSVDTLAAILNEEPVPIGAVNARAPAPLRWIVERCLAKDPDGRYASTKDLAREIATVRDHISEASSGGALPVERARPRLWPWIAAVLAATCLASAAYLVASRTVVVPPPSFQQLTFRRGSLYSARFAPGGETIVYTAAWDGEPMQIYVGRTRSADARPFGLQGAEVLSISKSGEMAVSQSRVMGPNTGPLRREGTLARVSIGGGTSPREILEKVEWADWAPDGESLAVVREERLEYPVGKVLYEMKTDGWLSDPRVSPDGESVAFIEHEQTAADEGVVLVVDRAGKSSKLAGPFYSALGLAWSPQGEVWFTAAETGNVGRALYSAASGEQPRLRARIAGSMTLRDISPQGRLLLTRDLSRMEIGAFLGEESKTRDLSWLDWSKPSNISRDGKWVLFTGPSGDFRAEGRPGGDPAYFVYLRKTDGSPPVRLGEGLAAFLSPDGKVALAVTKATAADPDPDIIVYSTGAGEPRHLPKTGLVSWGFGGNGFLPDGKRFVVTAAEPGRETSRVFLRSIDGGKPVPLTPEGYGGRLVSPDGTWLLVGNPGFPSPETRYFRCAIPGGELTEIKGLEARDRPSQISDDGRFLFLNGPKEIPRKVYRFEIATGRRELWRSVEPGDIAGVSELHVYPSGGDSYLYEYTRVLSDLYLVAGIR